MTTSISNKPGERTAPHSHDAEQAALGSMLLTNEIIGDVYEIINSPRAFYSASHGKIYATILDLHDKNRPADITTVAEELEKMGALEECGGRTYLAELAGGVATSANAKYYAEIVFEKWQLRRTIEAATDIIADCYEQMDDCDAIIDQAEQRIFEIADRRQIEEFKPISRILPQVFERLSDIHEAGGGLVGKTSGFCDLDEMISGFQNANYYVLGGRPSMGKAQPLSAKVLTPSGFIRMADVRPGQFVIGGDGKAYMVTGIFPQGKKDVYQFTFSDGSKTECCAEHLWFTQTRNERRRGCPGSIKTTAQIIDTIKRPDGRSPNHVIPLVGEISFSKKSKLRLDPYLLGLLLGDGHFSGNIKFIKPERDIQDKLIALLPEGDAVSRNGDTIRIRTSIRNNDQSETKKALTHYGLAALKSYNKYIPEDYLYASPSDRLALLRGLCDTDGHVCESGMLVEYSSSSRRMAEEVRFIARSLGGIVSWNVKKPTYSIGPIKHRGLDNYRLYISFPNGLCPVSSEKHLRIWKGPNPRHYRSIIEVRKIGSKLCQCLTIRAQHGLYVTDDFIVTHNSAIAMNIAENFCRAYPDITAAIFSLEMSEENLCQRALCGEGGVSSHDAGKGRLDQNGWRRLAEAAARLGQLKIHLDCSSDLTPIMARGKLRRLAAREHVGLVIVDYMQLMDTDKRHENRQQEITNISRRLKALATEFDVPVLALSQLSRAVESRGGNRRPQLSDLRESGAIEQDADTVMFIHRPEYYLRELDADDPKLMAVKGKAELIIDKQRNGPTGSVWLHFNKTFTRFENLAKEERYTPPPLGGKSASAGEKPF